ncbi:hypothetical protein FFWV33_16955 [Flavobacterium faecale]|uniref:Lipid/polyisoprenoid-binding YceI-like domain-containing protein n=1 Tax=Flavobacterium faecale TaxID=1355330 RepID=A0A2S1LH64_9FLAO|nr:YceI family protein [Flavobacterium faecale]AWG23094.1 hypothetical protein FFWV33_16955 [Flavobacterium faecale]
MKTNLLLLTLLLSQICFSQKTLTVSNATAQFEASVPIFEPVAAKNEQVAVALNTKRGYISFSIPMTKFRFASSLMEQHFNDHYLETDRYPNANFKGIIENFDLNAITDYPTNYLIKGKLKIHGQSKNITATIRLQRTMIGFVLTSNFSVLTDDYRVEIPFLIRNKISKTVNISIEVPFQTEATNLGAITVQTKPTN